MTGMMVNFMCQLDWCTRCLDVWSNNSLCVCEGVLNEINI